MEEKLNLFKSNKSVTYAKKKEDYLDISLITRAAQNKYNATGDLDFEINSMLCFLYVLSERISKHVLSRKRDLYFT